MKNTHTKSQIINWVKKITGKKLNPNYFDYAKKSGVYWFYIFAQKKNLLSIRYGTVSIQALLRRK